MPAKPLKNFEEITDALAGLFTAGPHGKVASLVAIRGLQGNWTNWFIIGIPSVIVTNTFLSWYLLCVFINNK